MQKESKAKASRLPLTFKAEAGQQADVSVQMAGRPSEVEITHNIELKSEIRQTPITAQDILSKSEEELKELVPEKTRETHNLLKSMKIMTAIMLGKDKNKELAQMLQTDKSFTSKQIKELEEQGLVKREGEGRDTKYVVDAFNLMKFLQTKVIIKWGKREEDKKEGKKEGGSDGGRN